MIGKSLLQSRQRPQDKDKEMLKDYENQDKDKEERIGHMYYS